MPDIEKAVEAAARALCRREGNPENTAFEGQLMWQSYLPEARTAIEAAMPHLSPSLAREEAAALAAGWTSSLRPGSEERRLGHAEAAREIAAAIRGLQ